MLVPMDAVKHLSVDFLNDRPPTVLALPLKSWISAHPAGSSTVRLHRLPMRAEEARDISSWHKADTPVHPPDVRFRG
jgi:hypothetical protein